MTNENRWTSLFQPLLPVIVATRVVIEGEEYRPEDVAFELKMRLSFAERYEANLGSRNAARSRKNALKRSLRASA